MTLTKIWFECDRIYGETADGRVLWQSLLYYPRLRFASEAQRKAHSLNAFGIHWDQLDEDISFESFFYPKPEPTGIARIFLLHPEINVSAFARRIGMQQSLLSAYIHGMKNPSDVQTQHILEELRKLGKELACI